MKMGNLLPTGIPVRMELQTNLFKCKMLYHNNVLKFANKYNVNSITSTRIIFHTVTVTPTLRVSRRIIK